MCIEYYVSLSLAEHFILWEDRFWFMHILFVCIIKLFAWFSVDLPAFTVILICFFNFSNICLLFFFFFFFTFFKYSSVICWNIKICFFSIFFYDNYIGFSGLDFVLHIYLSVWRTFFFFSIRLFWFVHTLLVCIIKSKLFACFHHSQWIYLPSQSFWFLYSFWPIFCLL